MILIDTDILIDLGHGTQEAIRCINEINLESEPVISIISRMEMIVGCRNKEELRLLDRFLKHFYVIPIDEDISEIASRLLHEFRLSHGLLIPDALIAATAISLQVEFITKNQKDYRFIQDLHLLPYPGPYAETMI